MSNSLDNRGKSNFAIGLTFSYIMFKNFYSGMVAFDRENLTRDNIAKRTWDYIDFYEMRGDIHVKDFLNLQKGF